MHPQHNCVTILVKRGLSLERVVSDLGHVAWVLGLWRGCSMGHIWRKVVMGAVM